MFLSNISGKEHLPPSPTGQDTSSDKDIPNKRLIICCDGTWQSPATVRPQLPSNVTLIARSLAPSGQGKDDKTCWQQIVYYDSGYRNRHTGPLKRYRRAARGRGLNVNVIEAYEFLVNNYVLGDEIYFFGFSHGAFTVRVLAGLVCRIGILRPAEMRMFPKIYARYNAITTHEPYVSVDQWWARELIGMEYTRPRNDISVKVVSVWDTTAGQSVGKKNNANSHKGFMFQQADIHPRLQYVFQALALDERRSTLSPLVMYVPFENKNTKLLQVWFPGRHNNIGGGDPDKWRAEYVVDHRYLAHISFAWMVDRVSPFLGFDHDSLLLNLQNLDFAPERQTKIKQVSEMIRKSLRGTFYRVFGSELRTPAQSQAHTKSATLMSKGGKSNEQIHPSVYVHQVGPASRGKTRKARKERYQKQRYIPRGLEDFRRRPRQDGFEWERASMFESQTCSKPRLKTKISIPEFVIPLKTYGSVPSMERLLIRDRPWMHALMRAMDLQNGIDSEELVLSAGGGTGGAGSCSGVVTRSAE